MVKNYESAWWSVELPSGWLAEKTDECASFYAEDGIGILQISAYRNEDREVSDVDLREFFSEEVRDGTTPAQIRCGAFTGLSAFNCAEEKYWRKLWLRKDHLFLYVTYNCKGAEKGKEDKAVDGILHSLTAF